MLLKLVTCNWLEELSLLDRLQHLSTCRVGLPIIMSALYLKHFLTDTCAV